MKKLWIFGDSYGCPNYKWVGGYKWPVELANVYDITNEAKAGVGTEYCLNKLDTQIKNTPNSELGEISLLFIIPNTNRFNFSFWHDPADQVMPNSILNQYHDPAFKKNIDTAMAKKLSQYKKFDKFILNFFKYYAFENSNNLFWLTLGKLKILSPKFKKVLIWPTQEIPRKFDLDLVQDTRLTIFKMQMEILSKRTYEFPRGSFYDPRANHVSEEDHIHIYNLLSRWMEDENITNDTLLDIWPDLK